MSEDKHHEILYNTLNQSAQEFDKQCMYIASGAFTVSFAFIKDIVKLTEAKEAWCLTYSWYWFAIVIIISLLGHFLSMLFNYKAIKFADETPEKFNNKIKKFNLTIYTFNVLSIIGILIGAFLLIKFVNINL